MTPQEILRRAADIIEAQPNAWTQGAPARNEQGLKVNPNHPTAICFCSIGAIQRAVINTPCAPWSKAEELLANSLSHTPGVMVKIVKWNDESRRTAAEVAAQMRKAALQTVTS
jgi:hypothetical protein